MTLIQFCYCKSAERLPSTCNNALNASVNILIQPEAHHCPVLEEPENKTTGVRQSSFKISWDTKRGDTVEKEDKSKENHKNLFFSPH